MKKIVAITAFFALFQMAANAQDKDLRFGVQVSPVFSTMGTSDNKINGNGTNLGLKLGMVGEVYFAENYAFLIGIGFAFNSGGTLRHELSGQYWTRTELPNGVDPTFLPGVDLKYGIQYVEIPFGMKFRTGGEFSQIHYFAELPIITLGFKSQATGAIMQSGTNEEQIDIKKEVGGLSLSWGLCGGVEYEVGPSTTLVGGLGFQRVFTDVTRDVEADKSKGYINNIILRLGVMF